MAAELTPAQLDEIATKLLGWTKFMDGVFKRDPDDTEYCGRLSPADAMLVLEAMGKWCIEQNMSEIRYKPVLEGPIYAVDGYVCCLMEYHGEKGWWLSRTQARSDTPAGAIFQCAAQLVERM